MTHVFKMNGAEWYAAETEEEAIRAMANDQGWDLAVAEGSRSAEEGIDEMRGMLEIEPGFPKMLSDEELLGLEVRKESANYSVECIVTFREHLDELVSSGAIPCSFAGPSCYGDYVAC